MADPEWLLETCRAIIASKQVKQFVVGITTNPTRRRSAYATWARKKGGTLNGFVVLDWGMSQAKTLKVEKHLFDGLINHPGYGVIKMHYHPSVTAADNQSVYLAWWSDWLVSV
ncbi:hypothetical protein [Sphingomonas sp. Leaf257]|uniref:hypothetical protein n=1 Tax=Sphingomonas sp. Leaf257 TaxID=1736309 RepID=UPI0012E228D3|nr:hypothetical protein [Sphingomonas sp. Leaf257]